VRVAPDEREDETARQSAIRACARLLRDLKRAHRRPPADVALPRVAIPARIDPVPVLSGCGSPAQQCVEHNFSGRRRHPALP
jgi:hypothetical protein